MNSSLTSAPAAQVRSTARKRMLVLYGQPEKYSTSFQTTQFTNAMSRWFDVVRIKVPDSPRPWLRSAHRIFANAIQPLWSPPAADYIFYANDGVLDLDRCSGCRLLYWYDAARNWLVDPPRRRDFVQWRRYRNVQRADHVFAVSAVQVEIARGLRPGRESSVHYLPVGVNCTIFDPARASAEPIRQRFRLPNKTIVGYLGYLGMVHGRVAGQPLVEIARRLVDSADVYFFVVGFGPGLEVLKQMAANAGVAAHFTFSGYVANDLVPDCIAAMDVCIDTLEPGFHSEARSETKLKQYMAMGRACVATAIGENCVDLDHGRCGMLAEPGNDALLAAVQSLCSNPKLRAELGAAARRRAVSAYDWDVLVQSLLGALELV